MTVYQNYYTFRKFQRRCGFSFNSSSKCRPIILYLYMYFIVFQIKIKSSLYSPYYAEACNELRGPPPRLSAWAAQLRRNVAAVASRWRHCVDLTGPGIERQTSRTDSVRLATELTAGHIVFDSFNWFYAL